jgi:hypothetical protein
VKRPKQGGGRRSFRPVERLDVGRKIHDTRENRIGVVLDTARQYSHPKAQPVYNYLVRWEDGQVQAISEHALRDDLKPLD